MKIQQTVQYYKKMTKNKNELRGIYTNDSLMEYIFTHIVKCGRVACIFTHMVKNVFI